MGMRVFSLAILSFDDCENICYSFDYRQHIDNINL